MLLHRRAHSDAGLAFTVPLRHSFNIEQNSMSLLLVKIVSQSIVPSVVSAYDTPASAAHHRIIQPLVMHSVATCLAYLESPHHSLFEFLSVNASPVMLVKFHTQPRVFDTCMWKQKEMENRN